MWTRAREQWKKINIKLCDKPKRRTIVGRCLNDGVYTSLSIFSLKLKKMNARIQHINVLWNFRSSWLKYGVCMCVCFFSRSYLLYVIFATIIKRKLYLGKKEQVYMWTCWDLVLINWGYSRHNIFSEARLRMCMFSTSRPRSFESISHNFYSLFFLFGKKEKFLWRLWYSILNNLKEK